MKVIGLLTERDVVDMLEDHTYLQQPVLEIARKKIIGIQPDRSVEYALHILIDNNIRRLVIIDENDDFIGIVTQEMIIDLLEDDHFRVNLKVSQVLSSSEQNIITLPIESVLEDSVSQMYTKNIGSVLISDGEEIVGIITERDVVRIASQDISMETPIDEVMSKPVITVAVDDPVQSIVDMMQSRQIRRVLVTDNNGSPVGVMSTRDIIKNIKGNYGLMLESKLNHTKRALNAIDEVIFELYFDNENVLIQWGNKIALETFGEGIIDHSITGLIDQVEWKHILSELEARGKITDHKVRMGEEDYLLSCNQYSGHQHQSLILICKNVTGYEDRLRHEQELRLEQEQTLQILQNAIDQQQNIVIVTNGKEIFRVNRAFREFFHISSLEEFQKKSGCIGEYFIAHDDFFHLGKLGQSESWLEVLATQHKEQTLVSMLEQTTAEPKAFALKVSQLDSGSKFYVATFFDVTDLHIKSKENYFKATHDPLTGIYNRAYFSDNLEHKREMMQRYDASLSLILFDIDHFKAINDNYGHLVGDDVLVTLATDVKKLLRKSDSLARWGGEEFVILLPNTKRKQAELIAENLRYQIEHLSFKQIEGLTASFGVAELLGDEDEKQLLHRVDEALYKAKAKGRNCVISG